MRIPWSTEPDQDVKLRPLPLEEQEVEEEGSLGMADRLGLFLERTSPCFLSAISSSVRPSMLSLLGELGAAGQVEGLATGLLDRLAQKSVGGLVQICQGPAKGPGMAMLPVRAWS